MKCRHLVIFLFALLSETMFYTAGNDGIVITSTESTKPKSSTDASNSSINPQIFSMHINAFVSNRYVRTFISSNVRNLKNKAEETVFSVILSENAFISDFEMEMEGQIYKGIVKDENEAKEIYQQAVSSGQSAAHIQFSARDSQVFTVSVNIEPKSKTIFRLVYEEFLQREDGLYEVVINIHPGQVVEDLQVQVYINESRPLTFVKTASLRTGNEIPNNEEQELNPSAQIDINNCSAVVKFNPDIDQQQKFAIYLGANEKNGLAGQFVVQYDVERDTQGGEVLLRDGYFVHLFAPKELEHLRKHVVFVLDNSGSMIGRKIDQLIEAMQNILPQLKPDDLFNMVRFTNDASVWDSEENKFALLDTISEPYGHLEAHLKNANLPQAVEATNQNIEKARSIVRDTSYMGETNIIAGLEIGLFLIKRTQEYTPNKYHPIIIFLTDGLPTVGMTSGHEITDTVTKLNSGEKRAAIFSLSFGAMADKDFVKKLSLKNLGFSRHIYDAADVSLQLQDFYRTISSPLMSNITFNYVDGVLDVTQTHYPTFFEGSELIVAGRTRANYELSPQVLGFCARGPVVLTTTLIKSVSSLERLWAYLTVKQILKEREATSVNTTELTKKALALALKYSFVTPVSSFVVVKSNQTDSIDNTTVTIQASLEPLYSNVQPLEVHRVALDPHDSNVQPPVYRADGTLMSSGHRRGRMGGPSRSKLHFMESDTTPLFSTTTESLTQNDTLPQWLDDLRKNNYTIKIPQGSFKLGQSGAVRYRPDCPTSPANSSGICTIIFDCPVFTLLTDINVYLQYFCPLNEYAGLCCPVEQETTTRRND